MSARLTEKVMLGFRQGVGDALDAFSHIMSGTEMVVMIDTSILVYFISFWMVESRSSTTSSLPSWISRTTQVRM